MACKPPEPRKIQYGACILKIVILILVSLFITPKLLAEDEASILRIHCWKGYSEPYIKDFQRFITKTHNLNVSIKVTHASDPQEFWDLSRAKKVDVICPVHSIFAGKWPFIKHNIVIPIPLKALPNYARVRSDLKEIVPSKTPESVYGVPYAIGEYSLAYNADKVDAPPSWEVLWTKQARNRYTVSQDYADANIYVTALAQGTPTSDIYSIDRLFDRLTSTGLHKRLISLAGNAFSVWEGTADHTEFDHLHYAATWGYAVVLANKRGLNWKIAKVKEKNTAWVDHWAITHAVLNNTQKRMLAEAWVNFSLSVDVQTHLAENWGITPTVDLCKPESQTCQNQPISSPSISIWQQQSRRTTNGYALLWNTALRKRQAQIDTPIQ